MFEKNRIIVIADTRRTEEKLILIDERQKKEGKKVYAQANVKINMISGTIIYIPDDYTC